MTALSKPLVATHPLAAALLLVAGGVTEGLALYATGILPQRAIRSQMTFASMIVMKMFLSALGTSMVVQSVMDWVAPERFKATRQYLKLAPGYVRAVGGCALLGIGMSFAGSGPTIVAAQAAAGITDAWVVIAGGLTGGLIFGLIEPKFLKLDVSCAAGTKLTLDQIFNKSYRAIAMPLGICLLSACAGLELMFPFKADARILGTSSLPLAWPTVAGLLIGGNQLSVRLLSGKGQGGSTSIMQIIATATGGAVSGRLKFTNLASFTQFLFVWVGTPLGVYILSRQVPGITTDHVFPRWQSFLGGLLTIMGARIASGCTCGNGITGSSELNMQSLAATAAIFGFGIAAGVSIKAFGV